MAEQSETETPEIRPPTENVCKICKAEFTSEKCPKLLPCLHTFCGPCLDKQTAAEGGKYKCPECFSVYEKSGIIEDLFALERLDQLVKGGQPDEKDGEKTPKCTACEENEDATSFCTECSEWLCEPCVFAHRRVRITKDHVIQLKEKVEEKVAGKTVKQRYMYCDRHPQEPLKLYCETCDKLTCRDCQLLQHQEHRYHFEHEASSQSKQFFLTLIDKMKAKRACIDNAKQLIAKRHDEIIAREKDVADEINNSVEKVLAEITKRAKAITTDLNLMCTAKKSQLNQRKAEVAQLASKIDHSMKFVQDIMENGSNLSILHTKSLIVNQVRSVIESRCEVPNPNHVVDIRYNHNCGFLIKNLNHLGLLFVDGVPFRPPTRQVESSSTAPVKSVETATPLANDNSQISKMNLFQSLQKLSPEQQKAFLDRLQIAGRNQNQQQAVMRSNGPPNRVAPNSYSNNNSHAPPAYNSNNNRFQPPNRPYPNGLMYPALRSFSGYNGNVSSTQSQLLTLAQLQQQRRNSQQQQPQNRMPGGRPMPPLIPRPSNNGMALPTQQMAYGSNVPKQNQSQTSPANLSVRPEMQGNQNWKWTYVNMPGFNSPTSAPTNGRPGYDHRPSSSNSNPDITRPDSLESSRTSPSSNSQRPASADSVRIKQEKDAAVSYGGFSSCSLASGDKTAVPGLPGVSEDNLAEVLRSLNEDGLPLNLGAPGIGHMTDAPPPNRHLPVASKHMDSPDPSEDYCACCHNGGELLCCDYCPKVFHFQCHIPAVTVAPSGSWKCTLCLDKDEVRIEKADSREVVYGSHKRKSPVGLTDKELKACERILLELFSHEASTPFHEPVSKSVPNYHKIITNPMDFTNIKCKLSRQHFNHYNTVREFMYDVKLVFTNCAMYNSEQSEVGRAGKTVREFFGKLVEKFLPYYVPLLKEDHPVVSLPQNLPTHLPSEAPVSPESPSTTPDSERAKGSKRRKMDDLALSRFVDNL